MSELQFPKNPIVGQQYDFPPYRHYWDGVKWKTMGIGYNPVNDLRSELEPKVNSNTVSVFEALRRSYAEAGFTLVDGSFEEGGTLTSTSDVLLHKASGIVYSGPIGSVAAGTDPTLVGSGYVPCTDVALRRELAGNGGAGLVAFKRAGLANTIASNLEKRLSTGALWLSDYAVAESTDHTLGVQRMFDDCPAGGAVHFDFPAKISDEIRISKPVTISSSNS